MNHNLNFKLKKILILTQQKDRLTKFVHFAPQSHPYIASKAANLYM